jgi:hypothetical protein
MACNVAAALVGGACKSWDATAKNLWAAQRLPLKFSCMLLKIAFSTKLMEWVMLSSTTQAAHSSNIPSVL